MKKLVVFLLVIGGLYGSIGNALVDSGTASINSTAVKMAKAGL
jgi:hypothetical protein